METKTNLQRTSFRPQALPAALLRERLGPQTQGKIIDWEAFHYGMLDHKFLNDPNPAVADHRRTIYELWVRELIDRIMDGDIPVYSKDGQLPRRLAAAQQAGVHNADVLIGSLFETQKLLQNMDEFFSRHKEIH
ncbi:MAG: hypothetical protein AB7G06_06920 [Bdellovibrionales bacterium]